MRTFILALALALVTTGCAKKECPANGGGGACPAPPPPPQPMPIDVGGLLTGFGGGGSGNGTFAVPGLGDIGVSVDCSKVTVTNNQPGAGKTTVDMACTFSKLGVTGSADIKMIVDKDGKGSISATGSADFFVKTLPINAFIDLGGGSQTGNTVTINATANGQCFTATLTRDGDKITVDVSNPKTKIEINKK